MLETDNFAFSWMYVLLFIGSAVVLYVYRSFCGLHLPPGPFCWPIFGSVGFFRAFKTRRHLVLSDLAEKYGNIFSVYAGTQLVVFLNGYDAIREAFVKQSSVFSDRPNWLPSLQIGLLEGKGLVWQSYAHAPSMRKFALQGLREFGFGKTSLQQKIQTEISAMTKVLNANIGQPFDMKSTIKKAVINVIHEIVFGERFQYDSPDSELLTHLMDEFFKGGIFISKNFMPRIIRLLLPRDEHVYLEKQKIVGGLKEYIYSRITKHERRFDAKNIHDFVDLYIATSNDASMNDQNANTKLHKGEVFRMILDLFLAGSETSSNTLHWCFMFMVKHPEIQERCFQEIQEVCDSSSGSVIEWSMRARMPYTHATLNEVQRLATIVPLGLPHANLEPARLLGYDIPENTIVFANIYSCAMDPTVWEKPEQFMPERHLDENGDFKLNTKHIPFGIGPRMCLGDSMAKMEIFLIFTNLIKHFKFRSSEEISAPSVKVDCPMSSATDFHVLVTKRRCLD